MRAAARKERFNSSGTRHCCSLFPLSHLLLTLLHVTHLASHSLQSSHIQPPSIPFFQSPACPTHSHTHIHLLSSTPNSSILPLHTLPPARSVPFPFPAIVCARRSCMGSVSNCVYRVPMCVFQFVFVGVLRVCFHLCLFVCLLVCLCLCVCRCVGWNSPCSRLRRLKGVTSCPPRSGMCLCVCVCVCVSVCQCISVC